MAATKMFGNLFLSIGAMKAGTTWLYSVLARHPELHFAMEKEIHYFNHRYVDDSLLSEERRLSEARERYLWRFDPQKANIDAIRQNLHWVAAYLDRPVDDFWYRNLFQLRKFQTYACDFSNLNAHLPAEVWPKIASKCDTLRVLYTMRDPVKRLWSHTKFHLQVTGELDKLNTWSKSEFEAFIRQPHIWDNGEYGAVLRRLSQGLDQVQYKAIFYEDLHDNQRGILHDIEGFLGITSFDYPQAELDRRVTESKKHKMPDFFPELVAGDVARIRREVEAQGYVLPLSWG
ncbi:Sulfotransferase family protein [Octadecabacter temperatus]|uniref:Sulfotransferase domain protein n=1 Tax=Octadecabacter temperatus TaxID=1458307 RepID=A0A0K0Y6V2_9RHOB|nr:sulfotransferase [Octadecabacter temperatus]AKS46645.1 Sulfotransferase domain protein [Octadecabacter temperatus]SIO18454.1 Sulfotransferase family protein [Octadecabacter temperatus]